MRNWMPTVLAGILGVSFGLAINPAQAHAAGTCGLCDESHVDTPIAPFVDLWCQPLEECDAWKCPLQIRRTYSYQCTPVHGSIYCTLDGVATLSENMEASCNWSSCACDYSPTGGVILTPNGCKLTDYYRLTC